MVRNQLFVLLFLALKGAYGEEGHDDNCVDLSRYLEVEYNETEVNLCTHSITRSCKPKTETVCQEVAETSCEVESTVSCENIPTVHTVHDDTALELTYQEKVCTPRLTQLTETKKMPVCKSVTKEQCDSKWVINSAGEKVWAGNENCKEVTWQDCKLEMVEVAQDVQVFDCVDGGVIEYTQPKVSEVEVTCYEQRCEASLYPVCRQTLVEKCAEVTCEECSDKVETKCFPASFKEPFQRYDHRLRCTVQH